MKRISLAVHVRVDEWMNGRTDEQKTIEGRGGIILLIYILFFLFISCVNSSDKTTPFFSSIRLFVYSSITADVMKKISLDVRVYEWMNCSTLKKVEWI